MAINFFTGLGRTSPLSGIDPVVSRIGSVITRFDPAALIQRSGEPPTAESVAKATISDKSFFTNSALRGTTFDDLEISSQESIPGPFETFFSRFRLEAIPFYNFWIPDEDLDEGAPLGDRRFEDVPRFIKVVWDRAPELPGEPLQRVKGVRRTDQEEALWVGRSTSHPSHHGIPFDLGHLDPVNFPIVRKAIANPYMAPGVISSVIDVVGEGSAPDPDISGAKVGPIHHVDEDTFLEHPDMSGISVQEVIANYLTRERARGISGGDVAQLGDRIEIRSVSPNAPVLSILSRVPLPRGTPVDSSVDIIGKISQDPASSLSPTRFRANFVDSGILGGVREDRLARSTSPEHVENMGALAAALPDISTNREAGVPPLDPPAFSSPVGLKPLEYVGYVLEKYRLDSSGVFKLFEEIDVPDRRISEYYDCRIKYGDVYRYRIRGIVRWTYPADDRTFDPIEGIRTTEGSAARKLAPFKSTYFGSEWSEWSYGTVLDTVPPDPPDELTLIPDSRNRRVLVTVKFPHDPQRDIEIIRLFRRLRDRQGKDLTDWDQVGPDHGPENFIYIDRDVDFFQESGLRYVYAAQSISRHGEESPLSEQLAVRLNKDRDIRGEFLVEFVSSAGVRREDFGSFSVRPARRTRSEIIIPFVGSDSRDPIATFTVGARDSRSRAILDEGIYVIRSESLDTGEVHESRVDLRTKILPDKIDRTLEAAKSETRDFKTSLERSVSRVQRDAGLDPRIRR